jgi:hypothetical protein
MASGVRVFADAMTSPAAFFAVRKKLCAGWLCERVGALDPTQIARIGGERFACAADSATAAEDFPAAAPRNFVIARGEATTRYRRRQLNRSAEREHRQGTLRSDAEPKF